MERDQDRSRRIRRAVAIGIVGATVGVTGAFAVAAEQVAPVPRTCAPAEADLLRAAYAARQLEAQHPELFGPSEPRAHYEDLRLAAEWARRMSFLRPTEPC